MKHLNVGDAHACRYKGKTIYFKLNDIKPKIGPIHYVLLFFNKIRFECRFISNYLLIFHLGRIRSLNLVIHDSYVTQDDVLLFLVDYNEYPDDGKKLFWVTMKQIQASQVNSYIDQMKLFINNENFCNSSKLLTLPCEKKTEPLWFFLLATIVELLFLIKKYSVMKLLRYCAGSGFYNGDNSKCFLWPKTLIYDDGCSLKKYVTNKSSLLFKQTTERAKKLAETRIVVDRFHFKSHVDEWCREWCDPDLYDDLKDVNSSICEETNYWFSKYKYIFKHMNYERYHFLLYIVLDEFNEANLIRKIYENEKKNAQL